MSSLKEITQRIEELECEKTQLLEEICSLRKEAEGKVISLECEVAVLREEVKSLKKMIEST